MNIVLYPPNGGKDGVTPHPSKVEEMKAKGWVEKNTKKKKIKEIDNG